MPGAPQPTYLPEPFANQAASQYRNLPIPDAPPSSPQNAASWQLGFPSITMQSELAGGLPPLGQDFNGILFTVTSHTYSQQAGQLYQFNATLAGTLGGYAAGAVLGMADGSGAWLNTQAGNTANPDTGGAGWVPAFSYGITYVSGLTGGTVTLTPAQARRNVIVLQGALTGNLTVIFPSTQQSWLVVNSTSGAFTTTVRTAAGSGVTVPQGGPGSPLGVWGDGANLYPSVAPLNLPIDQAATPLTIVQRTNAGYVFATYFNQSSSEDNLAIGYLYYDYGDGYHRKISLAHAQAQMSLANFAGQVTPAQVPYSAVSQWAANLFASPAFTGAPTAPTPGAGDSSAKLATTAFVQAALAAFSGARSLTPNGYYTLPGGLIIQWGYASNGGGIGPVPVTFPIRFPTTPLVAVCNTYGRSSTGGGGANFIESITNTGMTMYVDQSDAGVRGGFWIALGY